MIDRHSWRRRALLVIVALTISHAVAPQTSEPLTATLSIEVRDESGHPVADVNVSVRGAGFTARGETNENGKAMFTGVPRAALSIQVNPIGTPLAVKTIRYVVTTADARPEPIILEKQPL